MRARLTDVESEEARLAGYVELRRAELGSRLVDESFFSRPHEDWNLASPWLESAVQRKREDLFIAALRVHRAFIDCAAQKILHNLSILFSRRALPEERRHLYADLWSTLFMAVPVISTTFASVDRMLPQLGTGSIGWLLIDEAGQASPQAAVGAIMRAKRTVIVGDPLQIPPVLSLPESLTAAICAHFEVNPEQWAAPSISAQTLADRGSTYRGVFGEGAASRSVGVPLLVHRRCNEPMFAISNRIAYNRLMVSATPPGSSPIGEVLGTSRWFNVEGDAESHWVAAEGELVRQQLRQLANAGVQSPDLFVITPFRAVAWQMRLRLTNDQELLNALGVDRTWVENRVGTIHTVQGREAEAVFLVLGAPADNQAGARSWAAGTPNIINVAVSRAKHRLFVVGSYPAWSNVGYAQDLASSLAVV